jgi:hypothetical protein
MVPLSIDFLKMAGQNCAESGIIRIIIITRIAIAKQ